MIHYLEDYMYCTRKLGLYVQLRILCLSNLEEGVKALL